MSKVYYTLAVREDGAWSPQYGSYERQDCVDERQYYRDHRISARDLKIIKSGDTQAEVNAAIAQLNNEA